MRVVNSFIILLLLPGCASIFGHSDNDFLSQSYDLATYDQIKYVEVNSDDEIAFSIDEDNPAFNFIQGSSLFHAIKLSGNNRQFLLRSFFSDRKARRFASPVLLELDHDFQVVAKREPVLGYSNTPRYEGPHMQGMVELSKNTKYLIIYPSNDIQNTRSKTIRISPQTTSTSSGQYAFPAYISKRTLTKTITGKIELIPARVNS